MTTNFLVPFLPPILRHSFAAPLLQANVNLRFIQSCLVHERPEMTQLYTPIVSVKNNVVCGHLDRIIDKMKSAEEKEGKDMTVISGSSYLGDPHIHKF